MSIDAAAAPAGEAEEFTPDQGALVDFLVRHMRLKNDAALARELDLVPPVISKMRNGRNAIGAGTLIRMHEVSGVAIKELRSVMGDRRKYFRAPQGRLQDFKRAATA